ncbi:MAG: hypothetical protein RI591_03060 [Dehalococcoidia bacterium]|nr:hypothetical protein [Dehalococcoidia bacterium]
MKRGSFPFKRWKRGAYYEHRLFSIAGVLVPFLVIFIAFGLVTGIPRQGYDGAPIGMSGVEPRSQVAIAETYEATPDAPYNNPYLVRTLFDKEGQQIDEVIFPGRPPEIKATAAYVPEASIQMGINTLSNVPAFDWVYGCSATSAAMLMGYYDNNGYANMYTGPTNGGVCPVNNSIWGSGESPLSATHQGIDGLATRGHVDDYWVDYGSTDPDPFVTGNWTEHAHADCTADFMGTNQNSLGNSDGSTTFYYYPSGAPLYNYNCGSTCRDGGYGLRLFAESRGYTVTTNYNQYIYGYQGNTQGYTFDQFTAEIDAGRPVLIHVAGHTMLGFGYNTVGSVVYLHDTWDYTDHSMTWGGTYSGMQHFGVTVLQLEPTAPPTPTPTPTPVQVFGVTREVNCNILPDVTIGLDGTGPVYSNGNGSYGIYAPESGNYNISASKELFRNRDRTLYIEGPDPVTCDFQGLYGIIPDAPDIWYALECINLWLYPPNQECALDIWTALEVVNAWQYPVVD